MCLIKKLLVTYLMTVNKLLYSEHPEGKTSHEKSPTFENYRIFLWQDIRFLPGLEMRFKKIK